MLLSWYLRSVCVKLAEEVGLFRDFMNFVYARAVVDIFVPSVMQNEMCLRNNPGNIFS